jgi:glycosyltransferase involved in cell wall biosynthesis
MKILALEPYYGGSHRAFLDGWITRSRHAWTLLTLPATKWKWRMRHAPYTLARQAASAMVSGIEAGAPGGFRGPMIPSGKARGVVPAPPAGTSAGTSWDLIFASDMLNLAEFRGLAPEALRRLPAVLYFHENQITFPVEYEQERDHHFGFSNMNSALSADRVWFNSAFHRDSFLSGLGALLRRMPDHHSPEAVEAIRGRSRIRPPGIDLFPPRGPRPGGPLRILWAARWENDKRPDLFFDAVARLASLGVDFRLSVIGGGHASPVAPAFAEARPKLARRILHWGYLESREAYRAVLSTSDVAVFTADHEFFGISAVEAVAAGAYPLFPDRLAYPEILEGAGGEAKRRFLHDGSPADLARRLEELDRRLRQGDLWQGDPDCARRAVERFGWENLVPGWDRELEEMAELFPAGAS